MQASDPMPDNPWPNDMVIRIEDASSLTYLLFVRSTWQLDIDAVPALESEPDIGSSFKPRWSRPASS